MNNSNTCVSWKSKGDLCVNMFCIFSGLNLVCDEMCFSDASYIHELIFYGDPSTNRGLTPKMKVDSPVKNPVTKNVPPMKWDLMGHEKANMP